MIVYRWFYLVITIVLLQSCSFQKNEAQEIVDKAIEAHGGQLYENSIIEFDFRDRHYKLERDNGLFTYHRIFHDSAGTYHDVLNNYGFTRSLNDKQIKVDAEWARRYSNSINSVAYFALLPFGLNDLAVKKKLIGEERIGGNMYYKIMVTFDKEGGGEDHDDLFVYWFDKINYHMDYFGYKYISDGGGIRFREAINQRKVNGILFSDYVNYKGPHDMKDVGDLGKLFEVNQLEKLSDINNENLEVRRIK